MTLAHIAEVCHEANRAYGHTVGDWSIPEWVDAPPQTKLSAIEDVKELLRQKGDPQPDASRPARAMTAAIVNALAPFVKQSDGPEMPRRRRM